MDPVVHERMGTTETIELVQIMSLKLDKSIIQNEFDPWIS